MNLGKGWHLPILLVVVIVAACTSLADRPVFHSLEFGNDGQAEVRDVEVTYDGKVFPSGIADRNFGVAHMASVSETWTLPVPETAKVHWISADGLMHEVVIPVRTLIKSPQYFMGFRFFFVDDHVDVYVLSKTAYWPKDIDINATKAFSSK